MGVFTHTCDIAGATLGADEELVPAVAAAVELVLEVVLRARIRSNVF